MTQEFIPHLPDVLETPRLTLRPYHLADVDDVLAYAEDPEWSRYLPVPQPYRRADAEQFIAGQFLLDRAEHPTWAIEHQGQVVGGINLRFLQENQVGEMGYSIACVYWNQGMVTEAARAVINSAFASLPELRRIRAMADARNIGSQRVMEKLGMTREGVLRQNRLLRGELFDEAWYGILRSEWQGAA